MSKNNIFSVLCFLFFINSCTSLPPVAYLDITTSLYRQAFGYEATEITKEFYENFEYSFLRAEIGKSKDVILVLAYVNDNIFEWVSSDEISIFTKEGRIIKTKGLPHDIDITKLRRNLNFLNDENVFYEKINFSFPALYSANYVSELYRIDDYSFSTMGKEQIGFRIIETASISEIGWKVKNEYIYSLSGSPISTVQEIHPSLPKIRLDYYIK